MNEKVTRKWISDPHRPRVMQSCSRGRRRSVDRGTCDRQAAKQDRKLRFTALLHHIYNLETLRMAYFSLKKEAAPGVDGETWRHYGEELERNLQLSGSVEGVVSNHDPYSDSTRIYKQR